MKLIVLLSAIVIARTAVAAEDDGTAARQNLVGTWNGRVDRGATGHKLIITAEQISGIQDEKKDLGKGSFELDLTKKPWIMDATGTEGPQKGEKFLGIYLLEGDVLKWCVSSPGSERPTKFATKGSQFLLVLRRGK